MPSTDRRRRKRRVEVGRTGRSRITPVRRDSHNRFDRCRGRWFGVRRIDCRAGAAPLCRPQRAGRILASLDKLDLVSASGAAICTSRLSKRSSADSSVLARHRGCPTVAVRLGGKTNAQTGRGSPKPLFDFRQEFEWQRYLDFSFASPKAARLAVSSATDRKSRLTSSGGVNRLATSIACSTCSRTIQLDVD